MRDNVLEVLNLLHDEEHEAEYVSPNYVASYAAKAGIKLTSDEVVMISDYYGEEHDPSGRSGEYLTGKAGAKSSLRSGGEK